MQKALCQKLAHSIQQSIQREDTKETNQTAQVKKRPTQINTANSTKAAVPQTQTPAVLKDESKDSSGDIESIKRSNKRTHRRLRSDRRYSQDKTSVNNSKGQATETLQKQQSIEPPRIISMPSTIPRPDPAPNPATEPPLLPVMLPSMTNTASSNCIQYVCSSECLSSGEPVAQKDLNQKHASQACLESSDSEVKFLFDPIKSNHGRESAQGSVVNPASQSANIDSRRRTLESRPQIKQLICNDSLE